MLPSVPAGNGSATDRRCCSFSFAKYLFSSITLMQSPPGAQIKTARNARILRPGREITHAVRHDKPAVKRVVCNLELYCKTRPGRCEIPRASMNCWVERPTSFRQGKVGNQSPLKDYAAERAKATPIKCRQGASCGMFSFFELQQQPRKMANYG